VPAALMSPPRSRFSNSRKVASFVLLAFFILWASAFFLCGRCIVGLLLGPSHRAATDRPQLVAAAGCEYSYVIVIGQPLVHGADLRLAKAKTCQRTTTLR